MKYKVNAIIRCDVRVWTTVEADGYYQALEKAKDINTGSGMGVDYEIIHDRETMSLTIYREDDL
jgi:hypothetical protein